MAFDLKGEFKMAEQKIADAKWVGCSYVSTCNIYAQCLTVLYEASSSLYIHDIVYVFLSFSIQV